MALIAKKYNKNILLNKSEVKSIKMIKHDEFIINLTRNEKEIQGAIRITLNERISKKDIDFVVHEIKKTSERLRI